MIPCSAQKTISIDSYRATHVIDEYRLRGWYERCRKRWRWLTIRQRRFFALAIAWRETSRVQPVEPLHKKELHPSHRHARRRAATRGGSGGITQTEFLPSTPIVVRPWNRYSESNRSTGLEFGILFELHVDFRISVVGLSLAISRVVVRKSFPETPRDPIRPSF